MEFLQSWNLWSIPLTMYLAGVCAGLLVMTPPPLTPRRSSQIVAFGRVMVLSGVAVLVASVVSYLTAPPAITDDMYVLSAAISGMLALIGLLMDWWLMLATKTFRKPRDTTPRRAINEDRPGAGGAKREPEQQ